METTEWGKFYPTKVIQIIGVKLSKQISLSLAQTCKLFQKGVFSRGILEAVLRLDP